MDRLLVWIMWGVASLMVVLMILLVWRRVSAVYTPSPPPVVAELEQAASPLPAEYEFNAGLPVFTPSTGVASIVRSANSHTIIPTRSRSEIVEYSVQRGDSLFSIAGKYDLKPETILWANYKQLNDDPHMISVGLQLMIPPVDGVYYQWEAKDTIGEVASRFKTKPENILNWPGNRLDISAPKVETSKFVMIPGGSREFRQWVVPTIWRANAGANQSIAGGCNVPQGGSVGTGAFIWPTVNRFLSGNDYWSGHLAIDIAAATGASVFAADSGVVVYAAGIGGGYGNMVMIDHGNGYHTLYAHLDTISVYCGQNVYQGNRIGGAGATGRSTGPHLHFEIRYLGGFINPWYVLP
ncbi:MAG: M23 family metallopeptidase [Anaerolineaceae bacterium]|nr:M23 family metallopeptidase [Anaerolineaceae bacterium]